jgi:hypothetical protein
MSRSHLQQPCWAGISVAQLIQVTLENAQSGGMMPLMPVRETDEVLRRVQGEFLEMPGLRLTEAQARRLWGLDEVSCGALLGALVDAKFLFRTRDGAFMRIEHAAPAKATSGTHKNVAAA